MKLVRDVYPWTVQEEVRRGGDVPRPWNIGARESRRRCEGGRRMMGIGQGWWGSHGG